MQLKKIFMLNLTLILPLAILLLTACGNQPDVPSNADIPENSGISIERNTDTDGGEIEEIAKTDDINNINSENINSSNLKKDGFVFVYNGTSVYLGEYGDRVLEELAPVLKDYGEFDNCTSDGMLKTYYYSGFDLSTFVREETDRERVYSIALTDDSVSTAEGIYIGQTVADMIAAYGTQYEEMPGFFYRYSKGGTGLSFDIDNDIITAITYTLLIIDSGDG